MVVIILILGIAIIIGFIGIFLTNSFNNNIDKELEEFEKWVYKNDILK